MLRRAVTATLFLVSFAAASFAQTKPNFTGTWKLNVSKSDFGMLPAPESQTMVVTHTDPSIKADVSGVGPQGKQDSKLTYSTDGAETVNKTGGRDIKTKAGYADNTLVLDSKTTYQDQDVTLKSVWSLSADGKTFTQATHIALSLGEFDTKTVFEKQDGAAPAAPAEKAVSKTMAPTGPKPNFTGTWKLIPAKSDFSVLPGPEMRVDTIEHAEPAVKIARKENGPDGARDYIISMSNDGKEILNNWGGMEAKVTSIWEGNSHVMVTKLKFQDQDVTMRRVSTLSEDGKTMIAAVHLASAMGELDQKEVYEKQ